MQKLKRVVLFGLTLSIVLLAMVYFLQEKLIFLPTTLPQDYNYSFTSDFHEFFLDTPDGARLNALQFHTENPKGIILYFHGNAGDLSRWGKIVEPFTDLGYEVVVMDYRNYGKSIGKLSENALHNDAQLFYNHAKLQFDEEQIIVLGRSLGASIATKVASNNMPQKLILETPFYSLLDVAKERFSFLPLRHILKYKFTSYEYIQNVKSPIRIFHGTSDSVVPYESGKKLFESIPHEDKKLYTIENGEHNDLVNFESYQRAIQKELE
nr:alpha/beta fold hydrolase [uncultured Allomuricauda sp.]